MQHSRPSGQLPSGSLTEFRPVPVLAGIGGCSTIGKFFPNRRSRIADFIDDLL
jgi:hypothetical protein